MINFLNICEAFTKLQLHVLIPKQYCIWLFYIFLEYLILIGQLWHLAAKYLCIIMIVKL